MTMISSLCIAQMVSVPQQAKDMISYGLITVVAFAAVFCVIKCIQGADKLERGEEGKKTIASGVLVGAAPWVAKAAFEATGLWARMGLSMVPSGVVALPPEVINAITLTFWFIVCIALVFCVAKVIGGSMAIDRGEEGKVKIFSGIAIAAAPWIGVGAMKMSGFWDALGLVLI